ASISTCRQEVRSTSTSGSKAVIPRLQFRATNRHPPNGRLVRTPVDNAESRLAGRERHVVSDDRLGETLQDKRATLFSRYTSFERHVDALSEQYLALLGLAAEPCRDIAHGANRSVAGALGKSDLAQGRVTLGNANTKAQLAT